MVTVLVQQSDTQIADKPPADNAPQAVAPTLARVRLLMLISAVTTALAVAAVIGVIGYRVFAGVGSGAATMTDGTVMLPKGAHVVSTTIGDGRIVVTLDIAGNSEVRIFDLKTLQQTGRLRFGTEQ
jgi:hypothetical protein